MSEAIKQAVEDYLSHSDTVRIHAHVYENNLASMKVASSEKPASRTAALSIAIVMNC